MCRLHNFAILHNGHNCPCPLYILIALELSGPHLSELLPQ